MPKEVFYKKFGSSKITVYEHQNGEFTIDGGYNGIDVDDPYYFEPDELIKMCESLIEYAKKSREKYYNNDIGGNKDIVIVVDNLSEYPIKVFCGNPKYPNFHDVLDGEFDIDHLNDLWGMIKNYADIEEIDLKDLNMRFYGDSLLERLIMNTKDNNK